MQKICYIGHFVEQGANPLAFQRPHLSEQELAAATARFAVPCTDVVFVDHKGHMVLAKRRNPAAQGWWWFGGALGNGMTLLQGTQTIMNREIGLVPNTIRLLGMLIHFWESCRERPGGLRTDVIFLHYVQANEKMIENIRLNPSEYDVEAGLMRFDGTQPGLRPVLYGAYTAIQEDLRQRAAI